MTAHPLSVALMEARTHAEIVAALDAAEAYLQDHVDDEMSSLIEMSLKRLEAMDEIRDETGEEPGGSAVDRLASKL